MEIRWFGEEFGWFFFSILFLVRVVQHYPIHCSLHRTAQQEHCLEFLAGKGVSSTWVGGCLLQKKKDGRGYFLRNETHGLVQLDIWARPWGWDPRREAQALAGDGINV